MQKILLIGNGPSAISMKLGKEIDEFDGDVVRFNTYRIKGFEEYVGTRTDRWVACDIFPAWHKEYKEVILCSFNRKPDNPLLLKMKEFYPDCRNFPEDAWQTTMKIMKFSAPSSGAVATAYYAKDNEVYIYGFNFFAGAKHHYGDKLDACHHNAQKEMEYFRKLIMTGNVIPFHDYLKTCNYEILHKIYPGYGVGGNWFKDKIAEIAREKKVHTILDYGCGKGSLVKLLSKDFKAKGYDPYTEEYKLKPFMDFDMVVSTDFFEHLDKLNGTFGDIMSFNPRVQFHAISNRPAAQILPDGSNAHAIVKSQEWWKEKLGEMGEVTVIGHNDKQNFTMYKVES